MGNLGSLGSCAGMTDVDVHGLASDVRAIRHQYMDICLTACSCVTIDRFYVDPIGFKWLDLEELLTQDRRCDERVFHQHSTLFNLVRKERVSLREKVSDSRLTIPANC